MFCSAEQTKRILEEQRIIRSGEAHDANLCQYKSLSCVRCCLPHIGGDSHAGSAGYLGPHGLLMKFRNFNPLKDPRIEASQYEDSFPDVGREEMERRFSERRRLLLQNYDRSQPRLSLSRYMKAAQLNEGYRYEHAANAGPASLYLAGSVPAGAGKGELPECQLLGFVDAGRRVGCMAHPLAETSLGFDGRDYAGFFHHTGCCESVGCEASREFRFLSSAALKVFDGAVDGMSWYEYSRHSTSVLVYYLRAYDHLLLRLDERGCLDRLSLPALVEFTNSLYEGWPVREAGKGADGSGRRMDTLAILSTDIPLAERVMYIALDAWFLPDRFGEQLVQAREFVGRSIDALAG